jgi:hypothetical protein
MSNGLPITWLNDEQQPRSLPHGGGEYASLNAPHARNTQSKVIGNDRVPKNIQHQPPGNLLPGSACFSMPMLGPGFGPYPQQWSERFYWDPNFHANSLHMKALADAEARISDLTTKIEELTANSARLIKTFEGDVSENQVSAERAVQYER